MSSPNVVSVKTYFTSSFAFRVGRLFCDLCLFLPLSRGWLSLGWSICCRHTLTLHISSSEGGNTTLVFPLSFTLTSFSMIEHGTAVAMFCTGSTTWDGLMVSSSLEVTLVGVVASVGSPSLSIVGIVIVVSIGGSLSLTPGSSTSVLIVASGSGWVVFGKGGMSTSPNWSCWSSAGVGVASCFISTVFCSLDSFANTTFVVSLWFR